VGEEVLDLLEGDVGQVGEILHLCVALGELGRRHSEQLSSPPASSSISSTPTMRQLMNAPGTNRAGVGDDDVARVTVVRQRVRDEAVIAG